VNTEQLASNHTSFNKETISLLMKLLPPSFPFYTRLTSLLSLFTAVNG